LLTRPIFFIAVNNVIELKKIEIESKIRIGLLSIDKLNECSIPDRLCNEFLPNQAELNKSLGLRAIRISSIKEKNQEKKSATNLMRVLDC
jgi:hypothetical protein